MAAVAGLVKADSEAADSAVVGMVVANAAAWAAERGVGSAEDSAAEREEGWAAG